MLIWTWNGYCLWCTRHSKIATSTAMRHMFASTSFQSGKWRSRSFNYLVRCHIRGRTVVCLPFVQSIQKGNIMLQRILILSPSILGPGIQAILEHQMTWKLQVEPTLDLEAIAEACQAFQPQVTIVDADCIDVLALFESLGLPRVKQVGGIIVVTQASALEEEYLFFLFKWGVAACLTTAITPEELETIVERVYAGEYLLSSALLQPARPCASPRRTPETRSQMRAPAAPWQVDDQARARASPLSPQEVAILA